MQGARRVCRVRIFMSVLGQVVCAASTWRGLCLLCSRVWHVCVCVRVCERVRVRVCVRVSVSVLDACALSMALFV